MRPTQQYFHWVRVGSTPNLAASYTALQGQTQQWLNNM